MKNVRIRSFSGPYFEEFGLNIRTRKTSDTYTFHTVSDNKNQSMDSNSLEMGVTMA